MTKIINNNLFIIVIDGPMGSGKTRTAKLLKEKLKGVTLLSLADIKRFISNYDENHDYNVISQEVIIILAEEYLKRGINVIVEWAMKEERSHQFKNIAENYGARYFVFQLSAPKELLLDRVKERTQLLLEVDTLPDKNIQRIESNFEKNYNFHSERKPKYATVIDSEKTSTDEIVKQILQSIS
jgi:predicted kinase